MTPVYLHISYIICYNRLFRLCSISYIVLLCDMPAGSRGCCEWLVTKQSRWDQKKSQVGFAGRALVLLKRGFLDGVLAGARGVVVVES
jgi:hypothetical protein